MLTHWATPTVGVSLLLTVSTESLAAVGLDSLGSITEALRVTSVVIWALALAWLPALLLAEMLRPRLQNDVRRWSTVFPVGMYAAYSFVVGAAAPSGAITNFARVWVWVGLGVWLIVFTGMLRRGRLLLRDAPSAVGSRHGSTPAR